MHYLIDYIRANKRVPRAVEPFNEVDMLAFTCIPFLALDGIVSDKFADEDVTFAEAGWQYRLLYEKKGDNLGLLIPKEFCDMFLEMADSVRYGDLLLYGFCREFDAATEMQFGGICFGVPEGYSIVSYSGTDDSLLGWKEDLNLSLHGVIASQARAERYINDVMLARSEPITICGTSKGGHLSVYAAAKCFDHSRIERVFDFDGPGFTDEFLDSEAFLDISNRCLLIAPRYSAVSQMLNNIPNYVVTRGMRRGLYQHYCNRWIVEGSRFVREADFAPDTYVFHREFMQMMQDTTEEARQLCVDTVFSMAQKTGAKTLYDFWKDRHNYVPVIMAEFGKLDRKTRHETVALLQRFLHMIVKNYNVKR